MIYRNRVDAGRKLTLELAAYKDQPNVIVLALPRGGVPIGFEVAKALGAPLDIFLVRKLGVPGHEELAMGAIASGGVRVMNEQVMRVLPIPQRTVDAVAAEEQRELERREQLYRDGRPAPDVRDKTVILVDDGLATGSTMRAAITALRQLGPKRLVVAVPVGAVETCEEFQHEADEAICARTPDPFYAVGYWYADFEPTSDEEIRDLLTQSAANIKAQEAIAS